MPNDTLYTKALLVETKAMDDGAKVFHFRASTAVEDRQGEIVTADGWELANFRANPVFMLAHDYRSLPIGKIVDIRTEADGLIAGVVFDSEDPTARMVQSKYERGFLNAVSVGFRSLELLVPTDRGEPWRHTKKELLEVSAVAIPANPEALMLRMLTAGTGGDATADVLEHLITALSVAHTRTSNTDADADPLPHHDADGAAVWRAVAAAMAALMGAQGDVNVPLTEADRRGRYRHLAAHYRDLGKEPPEYRSADQLALLGQDDLTALFWAGEPELLGFASAKARRHNRRAGQALELLAQAQRFLAGPEDEDDEESDDGRTEERREAEASKGTSPEFDADVSAILKFVGRKGA